MLGVVRRWLQSSVVAVVLGPSLLGAAEGPEPGKAENAGKAPPTPADRIIEEADRLEGAGEYAKAITAYLSVLAGREADVLWRLAGTYADLGLSASEDDKKALFERAVEYGRKGVRAAPKSCFAHTMLAISLGRLALFVSTKDAIRISREIKQEADRAIALDKENFIPYIVLGIWNREIANLGFFEKAFANIFYDGLPEASMEASAKNLDHAVALKPEALMPHFELAVTCWEQGEKEKARRELRQVIDRPVSRVAESLLKPKARELLKKYGG
jgi:tetratricopeptide (TPR) repeat protein